MLIRFNVYLPAGIMIANIEFKNLVDKKVLHDIQR